jgi:hypothetical protein
MACGKNVVIVVINLNCVWYLVDAVIEGLELKRIRPFYRELENLQQRENNWYLTKQTQPST